MKNLNKLYENNCIPYAIVVQTVVLNKKMFNFKALKLDKPLRINVLYSLNLVTYDIYFAYAYTPFSFPFLLFN